jgi:hypothetical protein
MRSYRVKSNFADPCHLHFLECMNESIIYTLLFQGVFIPYQLFFDCLIIYSHVRSSKGKRKQKYQEKAIELTNQLTEWYNDGAENCGPLIVLIEAEALISTKDPPTLKIKKVYEEAIRSAKDAELLHIEALASERAALYFIGAGLGGNAPEYLKKAHFAYEQWGATAKAAQLEHLYPQYLDLANRPQRKVAASFKAHNITPRSNVQQREIGSGRHDNPAPLRLVQKGIASSSRRVKHLFAKKDSSNSPAKGNNSTSNLDTSESNLDADLPSKSPFRPSRRWGRSRAAKLHDDDDDVGSSPVTVTTSHKPPMPQSVQNSIPNKDSNQADEELSSPAVKTPKPRIRLIPRLRKGKKDKDKGDVAEKNDDSEEEIAKAPEL